MLSTYADREGTCHPSQATLARHLKRSRPWVNRVISDLTAYGLIEKSSRTRSSNAGTTSCEYRLVIKPEPVIEHEPPVPPVTHPCQTADTPCHDSDTTQLKTKHNQHTRPEARDAPVRSIPTRKTEQQPIQPVPPDWQPSVATKKAAKGLCPAVDLKAHALMFAAKCRAKGYHYLPDAIDDAWLAWLLEDRLRSDNRRDQPRNKTPHGADSGAVRLTPHEIAQQRLSAWASAAIAPPLPTDNPWR